MKDIKTPQDLMEQMSAMMPTFKANKNGYEIRTKILELAVGQEWQDYYAKWGAFETSVEKDNDEVITKVNMPGVPGAEQVLDTAQKFYDFVNKSHK
jgi:inorganic pyrophosphatase